MLLFKMQDVFAKAMYNKRNFEEEMSMACFVVPAAQAVVVRVATQAIKAKEKANSMAGSDVKAGANQAGALSSSWCASICS